LPIVAGADRSVVCSGFEVVPTLSKSRLRIGGTQKN
jgi:hypothetical protein